MILCLVRHEAWNDHIPAALTARGLAWRKVPYIDGWLRGWRLRTMFRNPVAFLAGNWRVLKIAREFRPTHIHAFNTFYLLSFLPALVLVRTPIVYRAAMCRRGTVGSGVCCGASSLREQSLCGCQPLHRRELHGGEVAAEQHRGHLRSTP